MVRIGGVGDKFAIGVSSKLREWVVVVGLEGLSVW